MKPTPLILASQSPRRYELLAAAGYDFSVSPPPESVESGFPAFQPVEKWIEELAMRKAKSVTDKIETGFVIAADTVAVCDGRILGKPRDRADAQSILTYLAGRVHEVLTGVCIWHRPTDHFVSTVARSVLEMSPLSAQQIDEYLATNAWQGKAGAFGYQDGPQWLQLIEGLESNVVGLPIEVLPELFQQLQIQLPTT